MHIEQGRVVSPNGLKYIAMDESLSQYQLEIDTRLLKDSDYIKEFPMRYFATSKLNSPAKQLC